MEVKSCLFLQYFMFHLCVVCSFLFVGFLSIFLLVCLQYLLNVLVYLAVGCELLVIFGTACVTLKTSLFLPKGER